MRYSNMAPAGSDQLIDVGLHDHAWSFPPCGGGAVTQKLYRAKIVPPSKIFATNIVLGGAILVAKSVPGSEKGPLAI